MEVLPTLDVCIVQDHTNALNHIHKAIRVGLHSRMYTFEYTLRTTDYMIRYENLKITQLRHCAH